MSVVTVFALVSMVTTREVLFPPPLPAAAPRAPWLESVPKSVPPWKPFSNARPMAGPSTWKLGRPAAFGFPIGVLFAHPLSKSARPCRHFPRDSKTMVDSPSLQPLLLAATSEPTPRVRRGGASPLAHPLSRRGPVVRPCASYSFALLGTGRRASCSSFEESLSVRVPTCACA